MQGGRQRLLLWMLAWLWEGVGDRRGSAGYGVFRGRKPVSRVGIGFRLVFVGVRPDRILVCADTQETDQRE
jgi:hypothetical protein